MMESISQIAILILGVGSVLLVGLKNPKIARWGYLAGLCSQPFWFYTTINNHQWGIVIAAIFYTISWGNGVRNHR